MTNECVDACPEELALGTGVNSGTCKTCTDAFPSDSDKRPYWDSMNGECVATCPVGANPTNDNEVC